MTIVKFQRGLTTKLYRQELWFVCSESSLFVCFEVLWPSQPNGIMSSELNLPNHTFFLGRLCPLSV